MARFRANSPLSSSLRPRRNPSFDSQRSSEEALAQPQCAVFNTTFSLHRASPLSVGSDGLSEACLRDLEQRLRDMLVAEVVRGVEVGLDGGGDGAMANAGALEVVTIEWVATQTAVAVASRPALQATLRYENARCSAVFLPLPEATEPVATSAATAEAPFLHLPLLLLRMPTTLKSVFVDFLASTFDCRIVPLRLSRRDIVHSWEAWARGTAVPTTGPLAKDAVLTLEFRLPGSRQTLDLTEKDAVGGLAASSAGAATDTTALGLRTIDIFVPNEDLRGFLRAGRQLHPERAQKSSTPFTDALARYVEHHLALDMTNPAVGVVRIACGGFVLSESRVKIFSPPEHGRDISSNRHRAIIPQLLGDLVLRARG